MGTGGHDVEALGMILAKVFDGVAVGAGIRDDMSCETELPKTASPDLID